MYTIKEAAARSGVSVPLLRAWERRYAIVEPARTPSGYRLYDEPAMRRLRAMRRLIDAGWTPSNAAAHLRSVDEATLDEILQDAPAVAEPNATPAQPNRAPQLIAAFVGAAAGMDEGAVEHVLDEMFASGSFEQVADQLVMPGLVALGEAWADGRVSVAGEHAAANAVARRLGAAFLAAGRPDGERGVVLVGLPPASRHELGALCFATALRRSGVPVRYLGADLPDHEWLEAARQTEAAAAVLGVVTSADVEPARRVAAALRRARPGMVIAVGGRAAAAVRTGRGRLLKLPDGLPAAVDALRGATVAAGSTDVPG